MGIINGIAIFAAVVIGLAFLIQKLAKRALTKIRAREAAQAINKNPFVIAHKQMLKEEKQHEEYLVWMDKNNVPGVPFEPTKSIEQAKADAKIKRLIG